MELMHQSKILGFVAEISLHFSDRQLVQKVSGSLQAVIKVPCAPAVVFE
jgi:hypothetical protein